MASVPFKVKALFEYTSSHEDDLPFAVGQIITVIEVEDADWYVGEYVDDSGTKLEGIFPQNFVEKYEPVAPPRPTRSRKKEPEPVAEAPAVPPIPPPTTTASEEATAPTSSVPEVKDPPEPEPAPLESRPVPPPPPPAEPATPADESLSPQATKAPSLPIVEPAAESRPPPPAPKQTEHAAASASTQGSTKAAASESRSGPPPVAAKSNAFRDRIAAFNKPAATPITPFKPSGLGSGGSGFIKKPFVAPPPSRNAYVPPVQQAPVSNTYRRDEDPEIKEREAEAQDNAEKAGLVPGNSNDAEDEDQPKPMSLKERMAMLQKQQAEQAQRHADAVAKKAKPKRPSKPRADSDGADPTSAAVDEDLTPLEQKETADTSSRKSIDSTRKSVDESPLARQPLPNRRKPSRGVENDGNEADMSGAGDTTEGQEDLTERDDSDAAPESLSRVATIPAPQEKASQDEEEVVAEAGHDADEEEQEEEVDPEVRRKEELRARMAKMSGGMGMGMMGMHGMLGMPPPPAPAKKKKAPPPPERRSSEHQDDAPTSPRGAPPVPTMMALPGMGRPSVSEEPVPAGDEEVGDETPVPATSPQATAPPKLSGERAPPPPVPAGSRPPPPPPPAGITTPSVGSESDDELSESQHKPSMDSTATATAARVPPPVPGAPPPLPTSPRDEELAGDELSPTSPTMPPHPNRRNSKPPPIPGAPPPVPGQARPPPPPPPTGHAQSRPSISGDAVATPMQPGPLDNGEEAEGTDYEGDYDTDIASSAPHKDALKSHAREGSVDAGSTAQSPPAAPPPIPNAAAPRAVPPPPPVPSQPAPPTRQSVDVPRAAPPPPPPGREPSFSDADYDPFNSNTMQKVSTGLSYASVSPRLEDAPQFPEPSPLQQVPPPPPPGGLGRTPSGPPPVRGHSARQSLDIPRQSMAGRRSVDAPRMLAGETGFFANDVDLAEHTKWWLTPNGLPPVFQGRKDILVESQESTSSGPGGRTSVNKVIKIVFQDYSQTIVTVDFDPQDNSSGEVDQQHEAPPRNLRPDEFERAYETYGIAIAQALTSKKDSVVGDGTPQGLIDELLKPHADALRPVGTRAYGALVYSNMGNAATQTHDQIRPGDIISIRNARFQGKHGPMHAKYSMEVGKPDHVAVVAEWDGTKKKVKAWEQGRENKKLKQESFRLDDLRSGEVKIWRIVSRNWIGWESMPAS